MRRGCVSGLLAALIALGAASEAAANTCVVCYGQGWIWGSETHRVKPKITMIMPGDKNWLKGGATHYLHETQSAETYKTQVKQPCYRCQGTGYEPGYTPPTEAQRAQNERDRLDKAVYVGNERFREGQVWGPRGYGLIKKGEGKNTRYGIVGGSLTHPKMVLYPAWQHIDLPRKDVELVRAQRNGKWGYLNTEGKVQIADVYDEAMPFLKAAGGQTPVKKNGRWGVIDLSGKAVLQFAYDALIRIDGRRWFARDGSKWGVVSTTASAPIVPIAWDYIRHDPVAGRFLVQLGDRFGLYDSAGRLKVPARFKRFEAAIHSYRVWEGDKIGVVIDGVVVVEPKYKSIEKRGELYVGVKSNGREVLHTKTGVSRSGVDDLEAVGGSLVVTTKGARKRLEDAKGKVLVKSVEAAAALPNGRILVSTTRGQGLYEGAGALVIKPKFDEIIVAGLAEPVFVRHKSKWGALTSAGKSLVPVEFEEIQRDLGGLRVKGAAGWGLVGPDGRAQIAPKYESLSESKYGLRIAKSGGKLGLVNEQGQVIFPFEYDQVGPFEATHPIVRVSKGKLGGLLHCDGRVLLPVEWTYLKAEKGTHVYATKPSLKSAQFLISDLLKGEVKNIKELDKPKPGISRSKSSSRESHDNGPRRASCGKGKWGFREANSKWVVPCEYDEVRAFSRGRERARTAAVRSGKKWGLVGLDGKVVLDPDYDELRRLTSILVGIRDDDEWGVFNEELHEVVLSPDCDTLRTMRGRVICLEDDDWSWVRHDGDREDMPDADARRFGLKK